MQSTKRLITIFAIIIFLGLGVYLFFSPSITKKGTQKFSSGIKQLMEEDFLDSPLEQLNMPEMDLEIPLELGSFNLEMPDLSGDSFANDIKTPEAGINVSGVNGEINIEKLMESGATPPPEWEPDETTCAQFKLAPSCSFVPAQYRDLCEKCKAKGY